MRVPPALAFATCTLVWGTTWIAIKIGYGGLDAVWGASLRFLLAGLLIIPLLFIYRVGLPRGKRQIGVILFVGLILFGLDYGFIYWGEQHISSGLTAVLFAITPLFIATYGATVIPEERVTARHIIGILVGLVGLILVFRDQLGLDEASAGPMLAIVCSASAAAISSVVVRRWGKDITPLALNNGAMLIGGLALLAASLALGEHPSLPATRNAWLALLYLVIFGSVISFLLYWQLLKDWGHNRSGLIVVLTPVVAVITGLAAGEQLTPLQWFGSALVLAGVAVSLLGHQRRPVVSSVPAASAGE
jgi:drug/metabolite transporter (DMT)-like permease